MPIETNSLSYFNPWKNMVGYDECIFFLNMSSIENLSACILVSLCQIKNKIVLS